MNMNDMYLKHKQWIETAGESGEQISLDEFDMHSISLDEPILEQGYFSACDFKEIVFNGVDFYLTEFYSCQFQGATFEECDFRKATVDYCDFTKATFRNCKFSRMDSYQAVFNNCVFENCSFVAVNLMESKMEGSLFEQCDFDDAYIDKATMTDARFITPSNLEKIKHISIIVSNNTLEGKAAIDCFCQTESISN